jgi:hypothetical protein
MPSGNPVIVRKRPSVTVLPQVTTYIDQAGVIINAAGTVKQYISPAPATVHTYAHNLGRNPIVEIQTLGGLPIVTDYVVTPTLVTVYLHTPLSIIITVA